jgi:hypothetical protein
VLRAPGQRARARGRGRQVAALYLALERALGALQVFQQQVLARKLVVVGEVVDALPLREVHLVQLVVDPSGSMLVGRELLEAM